MILVWPGLSVIEYTQYRLSSPLTKLMFASGVGAPLPWKTCPIRGSVENEPENCWKDVAQRSPVVTVASPLDVVTTIVLLSDPRLFEVTIVNVMGAAVVLVKKFIQRMYRSLVGT